MPEIYVPPVSDLAARLGEVIGKEVKAVEVDGGNQFSKEAHSAIYITREDNLAVIARVTLEFAARVGACLAMVPEASAKEAIESGELDEDLAEAYREVMNIMAGLLCKDGYPHVRLDTVDSCDPALRDEFLGALVEPALRYDLQLMIEDYGEGHLTLWAARLAEDEEEDES